MCDLERQDLNSYTRANQSDRILTRNSTASHQVIARCTDSFCIMGRKSKEYLLDRTNVATDDDAMISLEGFCGKSQFLQGE